MGAKHMNTQADFARTATTPHPNPLPYTTTVSRGLGSPQGERRGRYEGQAFRSTGATRPPKVLHETCHFTKRTHFEFEDFFMYLRYSQTLVTFAEAFANGFVLEKRTHFVRLRDSYGATRLTRRGVCASRMQGGMLKDRRFATQARRGRVFGSDRRYRGGAKERVLKTCVSTKRIHRFLVIFLL
jgi:hypothetical protein